MVQIKSIHFVKYFENTQKKFLIYAQTDQITVKYWNNFWTELIKLIFLLQKFISANLVLLRCRSVMSVYNPTIKRNLTY